MRVAAAAKTLARAARTPRQARPLSALEKDAEELKTMAPGFGIDAMARNGVPAYLDVQATSPVDPRVLDAMLPYSWATSATRILRRMPLDGNRKRR